MSTDLDSLGLLFSALFDAQQQGAKQTGGSQPFQLLDDFASGVGGAAEAAFQALYPGSISNDIVNKINKNLFAEIGVGAASGEIANRFSAQAITKGTYSVEFQAKVRNLMAQGYSSTEAVKKAKDEYGITLKGRKGPGLAFTPSSFLSAISNPAGTVDAITNKVFGNEPSRFWKVLMGGSALAGAGLAILAAQKNPHIQTKGDAVFIAGADPEKRKHAWAVETIGDAATLGAAKAHEKKAFDHAADLIARATHYTPDGQVMSADTKRKVEISKAAADAIVGYALENNLKPQDVIQNWDTHSSQIFNYMQSHTKNSTVARLLHGISHADWNRAVKRTWVAPTFYLGSLAGLKPGAPTSTGPIASPRQAFTPQTYLDHLWVYKKNPHAWRGKKFSGAHLSEANIQHMIDGSVEFMAQAADGHGDHDRANAYRTYLQDAHIRAHSLNAGEKLYWWKLKWDAYWNALGPQAGFGLLTGDFFMAASGAPLYHPAVNLNPKVNVFSLQDNLSNITGLVPNTYHADINNIANWQKKENNMLFSNHFRLSADGKHWLPQDHGFLVNFVKIASFGSQETMDAVFNSLKMYNGIPMISKRANKMQRGAYIIGTFHPYQLLTAFLDGSLGNRLMYIGLNFGRLGSAADFANLPLWQQRLFKMGLALNNNKYYRVYRKLAMYLKFGINLPNMMIMGAVNKVKDMYIKGFKLIGRGIKKFGKWVGEKLADTFIGRTVAFQFLKQLLAKIMDFFTGGLAEIALGVYNFLNFITGGLLDKLVFKGALYTILVILAWVILGIGGMGLLFSSATNALAKTNNTLPSPGYQYSGKDGYGPEDLDPATLQKLLDQDKQNSANAGLLGAASGNSDWLYNGSDLGVSSCPFRGYVTQMWCSGASTYHQNHQALDIAGGWGRVPVYAIVSGEATCIIPGSASYAAIRCRDGSFAGNGILLRGKTADGKNVEVWHLHIIQCTFTGTQHVEAGQAIGRTAGKNDLVAGNCWSGPHLHIHWKVNGVPDGKDLYCAIKKSCGSLPDAAGIDGKCSVSCN